MRPKIANNLHRFNICSNWIMLSLQLMIILFLCFTDKSIAKKIGHVLSSANNWISASTLLFLQIDCCSTLFIPNHYWASWPGPGGVGRVTIGVTSTINTNPDWDFNKG